MAAVSSDASTPSFFDYEELNLLYHRDELDGPLKQKLDALLRTPFVKNSTTTRVSFPRSGEFGEFLRVAHWNIQRGIEFDAIRALLTGDRAFAAMLDPEKFEGDPEAVAELMAEAALLRSADVIVLNEVDAGLKRTGYRDVAAELAEAVGMNYAFGVGFVELTPIHLTEKKRPAGDAAARELMEIIEVDRARYKGLHGVAILSRFPLENVRLVPFENQPYDWFKSEKKGPGVLEKGKRELTRRLFLEETFREVRRGGRTTLLADIVDDRFPAGRVTVVATHLENRTTPAGRRRQLQELLAGIREVPHPVIIAGDMNTSGSDLTPLSIRREFMKRFGSPKFWAKTAANYALGLGMLEDLVISGITIGRNHSDPTVKHIPYIAPNPERQFFEAIKKFRFSDGTAFDLRGDEGKSIGDKKKPFSNSNQRGGKGFVTTYQVKRPIMFIGKYKLDWILVKPPDLADPFDRKAPYRFAPHFGRTLTVVNEAIEGRISDHRPILVDLPLAEPN
jgi:endonuclease/exonuclease/phosphatase family metal-dependent hydrolase